MRPLSIATLKLQVGAHISQSLYLKLLTGQVHIAPAALLSVPLPSLLVMIHKLLPQ